MFFEWTIVFHLVCDLILLSTCWSIEYLLLILKRTFDQISNLFFVCIRWFITVDTVEKEIFFVEFSLFVSQFSDKQTNQLNK